MTIKIDTKLVGFNVPLNPTPAKRKSMLRVLANKTIEIIKTRVNNGWAISEGGRSGATTTFIGYSEGYKKYKKSIGRTPESVGDWLRLTGKMLASMGIVEIDSDHFIVGFSGTRPNTRPQSKSARKKQAKKERRQFKLVAAGYYKPGAERREGLKTYREALRAQKARSVKDVPNALLAWANDQLRPFVGLTDKEVDEAVEHMLQHAASKNWLK